MSVPVHVPTVSVVIPTFNRADDLRRCLNSLLTQTFDNFEVLVCDDGSTDHTALVISEYLTRLTIFYERSENFGGPARPRNLGIARARGVYIAFLDSDDWWSPSKLETCVRALEKGMDIVYHDLYAVRNVTQNIKQIRLRSSNPKKSMFTSLLCSGISIPNSSVVVRTQLLKKIGGISEDHNLISIEDYDTWIRLSQITDLFFRIPKCLGYYWIGGGNISTATPLQQEKIRYIYSKYLDQLSVNDQKRAIGFLEYRISRIAIMHGDLKTAVRCMASTFQYPIPLLYRFKAVFFLIRYKLMKSN